MQAASDDASMGISRRDFPVAPILVVSPVLVLDKISSENRARGYVNVWVG